MRLTQGTFSFLPEFTDEQITAQIRYALGHDWSMSVEYTDDPHPRNSYWEMWGPPMFDLMPEDSEVVLREVRACREAHGDKYVKLIAYDARRGRQTTALSFVVNRPADEPGIRVRRTEAHDRVIRYELAPYAVDRPSGARYSNPNGAAEAADSNGAPGAQAGANGAS